MIDSGNKKRSKSLIINALNSFGEWISRCFCTGFFGRIFTSYDKIEKKASNGLLSQVVTRDPGGREKSIRRKFLELFDQSWVMNILRKIQIFFKSKKINFYGTFFLTFGIYSTIIQIIKFYFTDNDAWLFQLFSSFDFICSVSLTLACIPLLSCDKTIMQGVRESKLAKSFFKAFAGIDDESLSDTGQNAGVGDIFLAIISGILISTITFFTGSASIIAAIFLILFLAIVLNRPEFGLIITIFVSPFLGFSSHPSMTLFLLVGVTFISYILKVLVCKRTFKFRLVDFFVALFALLLCMGGIVTLGGKESLHSAIMYSSLLMIYFLIVNLINTKDWLKRCIISISVPSAIVSFVGLLGYAHTAIPQKWLDYSMFGDISSRAVSTFNNPNMLATYLVLTAPFIWLWMGDKDISFRGKFWASVGVVISTLCTVLTWSRGGWIGIIVAAVIFLLMNCKHIFKYFLALALTSPLWVKILPASFINRFQSIGNLTDSSTYYRMFTWKGSLKMFSDHFMGGIGVGESAFAQVYPLYSYIGNETTMHSHSLFLEVAVSLGIFGLIILLILFFMISQRGFGCLKNNSDNKFAVLSVSAAISAFAGAIVHGFVDYIWYNYRVFFMFWVIAAMICACANIFPKKEANIDANEAEITEASLDVNFSK